MKKVNIIYLSLLITYVLVATYAFVMFKQPISYFADKSYVIGIIVAVTSIPHLLIYVLNGGLKNKAKLPYAVYGIIGIGLGSFIMLSKNLSLEIICLIWGVFDITRSTFEIIDVTPEVLEKKYIEIIEIGISISEIVIAVMLIIHRAEAIGHHIMFIGVFFAIYFAKYIVANLLKKNEEE